jgi:PAS domain S-box-containing protein
MFSNWRRTQKLPDKAPSALQPRGAERTNELEKANEDLKTAQAELQKRWQYLAEAQKLSHSGTFGWKVSTGELIWTEETYKILGFTRETNPSLDLVFDRIHPDDRDRLQQLRDRAAQNGIDLDVEHRILLPDGALRYLHLVAHAGEDRSGNREYVGMVSDITERKLAEQERQALSRDLKESNARLEEAQRVAHVGYWEWDLETGEVIWSDETYRIFGLKPQERPMNLAMVRQMVHPEDRDALYGGVDAEIEAGVHPIAEFRIVTPSGEVRTVHAITSKLWGATRGDPDNEASGKARRLFGTVQDVTETKRAEEAHHALSRDLQESKAWLEEAQRVAHLGYWVWDLETNQVIWSEETYRIFGLTPRVGSMDIAIVGEMFHPDDREAVFRTAEEAIRSGTRADCEHRLIRPDGEIRVVHSLGDLKTNSAGRPYQMFGTTQDITDRKRAEEALQRMSGSFQDSNARLEEAQRIAHVGHWDWNLETGSLAWSDETYRIYGMAPQERPIDIAMLREMIHPEDRESMFRKAEESLLSGVPADAEHRIVRPNGEVRTVHSRADARRDASGRPYEMFGTVQDVTEGKRAEQALRRSQSYLSEGERLAHVGSWASTNLGISSGDDLGLYWSDELYRIFGLDPKNGAPGLEQCLAYVHPQDRAFIAEKVKAMHEEHCICDVTHRIVRPDGEMRYIRVVSNPVVEQGAFKGYIGTTIDVTEQELLTQELRREQAYLTDAQSMAHIGSWAYNLVTRKVLHSSDENARLYGFDPSEGPISAERFFATQHAEDAPHVNAVLERAVREGTDFYLDEYRIHHTDGSIRFLRAIGHRNASGEPGEYIGVTMDITERKRAEEEREKLRQLQADLSHINRINMMGELAAALAHEIKQPIAASITSANTCLRWLAHDPPNLERARAAAARSEQEGNRAADVINRLRSFYKKGVPPKREMVDIEAILLEMAALLRTEATRHTVTIHSAVDADTPKILVDRVQLQQVFMNLMLNAIEAMQDSGGELMITARPNPEDQIIVSISDTGVGLPTENAERIFDAFHTTKPEGTGMGLAITRSIVESHGGRVWATANEGPGATFHFTLPIEAEAHA